MRQFTHGAVEIGSDAPVLINAVGQGGASFKLMNIGESVVYVGSESVVAQGLTMGFPVNPGGEGDFTCYESDVIEIYGICAEGESSLVAFLAG